jgi:HSP20 family molecular chaperone IbpA
MKQQLTTLSLISLFAFSTPALIGTVKEAAEIEATVNDREDSWDAIFNDMHNSINRMQHKMAEDFESNMQHLRDGMEEILAVAAMPSLNISSTDNELKIEITGISTSDIEIKADSDRLQIKAAEATIDLSVDGNLLTAYMTQKNSQETSKDGSKAQQRSLSQSAATQSIRHTVDFSKAKAKSDEKEKRLTITIPFNVKTLTQSIPVEKISK